MSDELIEYFVEEARELAQVAGDDLLALERAPGDAARLDSVFRAIHTLKGSAGLFDFGPMSDALHAAEDLLGALRTGRIAAGRPPLGALLACIGAAEGWIEAIAIAGALPTSAPATSERLIEALRAPLGPAAPPSTAPPSDTPGWLTTLLNRHPMLAEQRGLTGVRYAPSRDCFFRGDDPVALVRAIPGLRALDIATAEQPDLAAFDPFICTLLFEALCAASPEEVGRVFRLVPDEVEMAAVPQRRWPVPVPVLASVPVGTAVAGARVLRVDADRIDTLADIAGELIVAKNRLSHLVAEAERAAPALAQALATTQAELDRLVGGLNRAVARTRLVPLGQTTRRLPRLVREIAGRLDKPVRFDLTGVDTEADKTIVDNLFEPLLHILRNAIDHGIEPRAARLAAAKPEEGRVHLHAAREADRIVITVTDDGAGIDPAKLRAAALARGIADPAAIAAMDDAGALDLVFAAGFSTAAAVTDLSGRGVGLDVVRMAVRAMGGEVDIASAPGQGATVRLSVPQAVVVTAVILVEAAGDVFGLPIETVARTARVPATRILPVRDGRACVLRGRTVPVLRLADLLGLACPPLRAAAPKVGDCKLVVVGRPGRQVGVEVERIGARMEVAIRPLDRLLAGVKCVLGATLLGDGRVLLVLDIAELVG